MYILYLVDKYPQTGEPKAGKYPSIYNAMVDRGHDVCMVAHSAIIRDRISTLRRPEIKYRNYTDKSSMVIECYGQRYYMHKLAPITRLLPISRRLKAIMASVAVSEGLTAAKGYIEKHGVPDIIHAYGEKDLISASVALRLNQEFRTPFVWNIHWSGGYKLSSVNNKTERKISKILPFCNQLLPVSEPLGRKWEKVFGDTIEYEWTTIPNPVNQSVFNLTEVMQNEGDTLKFFHISKMNNNKDIPTLLKAFAGEFKNKNAELRLAGNRNPGRHIANTIEELQIKDQVSILGLLKQAEVAKEMQSCHIYVQSSRVETFCIPVAEALVSGKPVVVTRSGGPESFVLPDAGEIVEPGNAAALGMAMKKVADNLSYYDSDRIRDNAVKMFGLDNVCSKMEQIYKKVIKQ